MNNMADMDPSSKRSGLRLVKKRREKSFSFARLPERFADGDNVNDEVATLETQHASNMSQPVFSLIAAVGSNINHHSRFEEDPSESESGVDAQFLNCSLRIYSSFLGLFVDEYPFIFSTASLAILCNG